MTDITILCVDDEHYIVDSIHDYVPIAFACTTSTNPVEALGYLRDNHVDILVVDFRMPGINGLELLREAKKLGAYQIGILLTAYADKDPLASLINDGLVDSALEKPLDLPRLMLEHDCVARRNRDNRDTSDKIKDIYRLLSLNADNDMEFIGKDDDLADIWKLVETIATTDENVLVTGETGTGKDMIARQIHSMSSRADKPFIKINCGAIPSTRMESELFGYEKGAFSGADRRKFGKIELAQNGILFLDEIGEPPLELQSRLLHVVEDKVVERVGGTEAIPIDFRLISATNKKLDMLSKDEFRRDLFYRISTVHIRLPDLSSRTRDLPIHIQSIVRRNARLFGKALDGVSEEAMRLLCAYQWPGNIRELDNLLKRAIIMKCDGDTMLCAADFCGETVCKDVDFPDSLEQMARLVVDGGLSLHYIEHALLQRILALCDGRIMEASRKTGIPRDRFYRLQDKPES